MTLISESNTEDFVLKLLQDQGWQCFTSEELEWERASLSEVVLKRRLKRAIENINPSVAKEAREQALQQVLNLPSQSLMGNNEAFHLMLTEGIEVVESVGEEGMRGNKVWLVDYDNPDNNDFLACNQFTVIENNNNKRPDLVLFVNGLPLVVIELKDPTDEKATLQRAFTQLQNYKNAIPSLFYYNALLVTSDGLDARAGTVSSDIARFHAWKSIDGLKDDKTTIPQIETMVKGMLTKPVLLDLTRHFTVFEKNKKEDHKTGLFSIMAVKKVAAYHQYFAVNKAIEKTLQATSEQGDGKIGVVWHTQGSGKSLSMVFYTGKTVLMLNNPTIVVVTDRNDLDDQLFDTFAGCKQLLRQDPAQSKSRENLKALLRVAGGGVVFTTMQKFMPEGNSIQFDLLSERKNIVVIVDEAHRSQYEFGLKTRTNKNGELTSSYGLAKYLRDALPHASFIGFTGTPIEKDDRSTPAVFGDYVDVYDIARAVDDGAAVPIYYESRLVKVHLKPEEAEKIDEEVEAITEGEESTTNEKIKAKLTQTEAIVGNQERLRIIAKDIVEHFQKRREVFEGKGMIVCMSRRIAVELYKEIISIRPDWDSDDLSKGVIKVVMTSSSSDPEDWQKHNTTKRKRRAISERFKDESDELQLVIVRDMWLTGFDAPCLNTMYVDKFMSGHNLMQAIARVNRIFKDKEGGLIVDYIGIASRLQEVMVTYTESGGRGALTLDQRQAVDTMIEAFEVVEQMFAGFSYKRYFSADTGMKLTILLEAQEHILEIDKGNAKDIYLEEVARLSRSFALVVPHPEAIRIRDDVGFFQAVKARLTNLNQVGREGRMPRLKPLYDR